VQNPDFSSCLKEVLVTQLVAVEEKSATRILRMQRPAVRNALNSELVQDLLDALEAAEKEPHVRVVILTGAGQDFCAGADLKVLRQIAERSLQENLEDSRHLARLFVKIHTLDKPVVAAVRGNALAGGCGLACVCDLVVCAEDSRFGFTEARIGFVAAIVSRFLIDRVGAGRARDLLLTGRRLGSPEALQMGLVDTVVPAEVVEDSALERAAALAMCAGSSLRLTKKLLAELPGKTLAEALEFASRLNAETRGTEDCKEGIRAFLDKRKPSWLDPPTSE
jgi:methylglutaconyl-CoA hydratase